MSALTQDRNTNQRRGVRFNDPVAASKKIYAGALVALSATGYLTPGAVATTLVARGVAQEQVDNSAGADGDLTCEVEPGTYKFGNSAAGDLITIAEIGDDCYIVDDQTVAKTNGTSTRSVAGKVVAVDSDGVWVRVGV